MGGVWILRLCEFLQLNVEIGCVPALGCLGGSALDFLEVEHLSTISTSPDFHQILSRRPDFEVQLLPLTAARNGLEAGPAQEVPFARLLASSFPSSPGSAWTFIGFPLCFLLFVQQFTHSHFLDAQFPL